MELNTAVQLVVYVAVLQSLCYYVKCDINGLPCSIVLVILAKSYPVPIPLQISRASSQFFSSSYAR